MKKKIDKDFQKSFINIKIILNRFKEIDKDILSNISKLQEKMVNIKDTLDGLDKKLYFSDIVKKDIPQMIDLYNNATNKVEAKKTIMNIFNNIFEYINENVENIQINDELKKLRVLEKIHQKKLSHAI